jgi:hypothetical protein
MNKVMVVVFLLFLTVTNFTEAQKPSNDAMIAQQSKKIAQLEQRIAVLEADHVIKKAPFWVKDIAQEAYDRHYIEKVDGHSLDFYKVLNMMFQAGAL